MPRRPIQGERGFSFGDYVKSDLLDAARCGVSRTRSSISSLFVGSCPGRFRASSHQLSKACFSPVTSRSLILLRVSATPSNMR